MKRCILASLLLGLLFVIVGCNMPIGKQVEDPATTESSASSVSTVSADSSSKIEIVTRKAPDIVFDGLGDMPLIYDGNVVGTVRINQVEKLQMTDFTNEVATAAGVSFSYAINMKLNLAAYSGSMITVSCTPSLVDANGNSIGSVGDIGWSGFSSQAAYVNDCADDKYVEVILQPEVVAIPEDSKIKLSFSSLDGNTTFSDLYISPTLLYTAKEGPGIKTVSDVTKIESINGASYSIKFHDAHYQWNIKSNDTSNQYSFFNFVYDLKYLHLPSNNRHVNTFDSFDSHSLTTPLIVGMQMDSHKDVLYDNDTSAMRLMYKDDPSYYPYVSEWEKALNVGEKVSMVCNREYKDNRDNYNPTYIRLRVEFPEEASARTPEELLQFNGRYCVYQLKIEPTQLIDKEDSNEKDNNN